MATTDLADAVQVAMFARLKEVVTLAPVLAVVPDDLKPPYVVIASASQDDFGIKGGAVKRHQVQVRYYVPGTSKRDLFAVMNQGKDALLEQDISSDGALLSRPALLSASDYRDTDIPALVGEQEWLVIAQPG